MRLNIKNIITGIVLAGLFIPFILITDLFPFLRFGMFAEPIKSTFQTEVFIILQTDRQNKKERFNPSQIGANENIFKHLCRNYYYRNELGSFAQKIFKSSIDTKIIQLDFYKITYPQKSTIGDTLFLDSIKNEKK